MATLTLKVQPPRIIPGSPAGTRWVVEVDEGWLEGERLDGAVAGSANADWFVVGPDDVGTVDSRLNITTRDGTNVLMQYNGRVDLRSPDHIYIAPRFDAPEGKHRWLNLVQGVGRGSFRDRVTLVYELYELR